MKIYQVTEDLGDGDVAIFNFRSLEEAEKYMTENEEYTYHEGNPHVLDMDNVNYRVW